MQSCPRASKATVICYIVTPEPLKEIRGWTDDSNSWTATVYGLVDTDPSDSAAHLEMEEVYQKHNACAHRLKDELLLYNYHLRRHSSMLAHSIMCIRNVTIGAYKATPPGSPLGTRETPRTQYQASGLYQIVLKPLQLDDSPSSKGNQVEDRAYGYERPVIESEHSACIIAKSYRPLARSWSYDNVPMYQPMKMPPSIKKRKVKQIVDGVEKEVTIQVQVENNGKHLFNFPDKEYYARHEWRRTSHILSHLPLFISSSGTLHTCYNPLAVVQHYTQAVDLMPRFIMQPELESNSELSDLTESEGRANLSVLVQDTDCVTFKKKLGKNTQNSRYATYDIRLIVIGQHAVFTALRAEYPDFVYEREIFDKGVTVDVILFLQKCCNKENLLVSAISPVDMHGLVVDLQKVASQGMPVHSHSLSPSTPRNLEAVVLATNDHRHIPIIEGECRLSDFDYLWIQGLPFVSVPWSIVKSLMAHAKTLSIHFCNDVYICIWAECMEVEGPKLYAAMTSRQNGSTRLHINISDMVNIMVDDGKVLWHIFSSEHLETLKEFVVSKLQDDNQQSFSQIDSISSYHVYLTDKHLKTLKAHYNVRPFTFEQHHCDVVFIPAGCAHQVSNITLCAKIAMDFLAPQSLQQCIKVDQNLHTCCQTNKDTLELSLLLFHCWMALSVFKKQLIQAKETDITDSALSNQANSTPVAAASNPHSDFRSAILNVLSEVQPPMVTPAPYVGTLPMSTNFYSQPHIIPYPYAVHPHMYAPPSPGFQPTPAVAAGSFASVFSVTSHAAVLCILFEKLEHVKIVI
ncbi:Clavaminate synthase protein [Salix suchowensis]|nr:Clavaminate synthase protein [Salix suchowensis]